MNNKEKKEKGSASKKTEIIAKPKIIKKKIKKNITTGIAYVNATFNNTIISIADDSGNVIAWSSAGAKGFKGSRKSTPYAAQIAADEVATKAIESGVKSLVVEIKGPSEISTSSPEML